MTGHEQVFNFQTLSPDLIIDALFAYGIRVDSGLTPLNSYENRVYQFQEEQGKRHVVKFYRPQRWSAAQIAEEHQFVITLQHHAIPLAAPQVFGGESVLHYRGFRFAVYESLGGRQFAADDPEQMEWVGSYLGRMHQVGRSKLFTARPAITPGEYLHQPRQVFAQSTLIPSALKTKFLQGCDALINKVMHHWHTDFQPLRLHGDCHAGNILWRDGPLFVDFDDARNGPAIQDLWMLLHGKRTDQQRQLAMLAEAYTEFCPLDLADLSLIEPLRAMRLVYYLAWLIRRWHDPAFVRNFPWLSEEGYWQQQITTFHAQCKVLDELPLQLTPMY